MNSTSMKSSFSLERVIVLCKRYIAIKKNMILIGITVMTSLIVVFGIMNFLYLNLMGNISGSVLSFSFTIFTYAGYAFSSIMFNEANSAGEASQFLTLPASSAEKLFSAWCISYFVYTTIGVISLYLLSLFLGDDNNFFFSVVTVNKFLIYTASHSIFLFGAAYFKANNFLSTIVAMLLSVIVFGLILIFLKNIGFWHNGWSLSLLLGIDKSDSLGWLIKNLVLAISVSAFFLWMTLRRLKNRQIA